MSRMVDSVNDLGLAQLRKAHGYWSPSDLLALAQDGIVVHDPYGSLVSRSVRLNPGVITYPGVVIQCDERSQCTIGPGVVLWAGSSVHALNGGQVHLRESTALGEHGGEVRADHPNAVIRTGALVRIAHGAQITGVSTLGGGSQVVGHIAARSVTLAAGGDHTEPTRTNVAAS